MSDARKTSWTAKELLDVELPEPRYAVDELITEGLTFECGAPKIGKSWLGLGLGIAVAAGGFAFGKIKVEQGDVLYLALEDNPRRLQTRLRMLLHGDPPPEGLYIETEWERFDRGGIERLQTWLDEHPDTRLVVIDVWTRIRPFAQNHSDRYQADYEAASVVQALAVSKASPCSPSTTRAKPRAPTSSRPCRARSAPPAPPTRSSSSSVRAERPTRPCM
jgi:AAA domain